MPIFRSPVAQGHYLASPTGQTIVARDLRIVLYDAEGLKNHGNVFTQFKKTLEKIQLMFYGAEKDICSLSHILSSPVKNGPYLTSCGDQTIKATDLRFVLLYAEGLEVHGNTLKQLKMTLQNILTPKPMKL